MNGVSLSADKKKLIVSGSLSFDSVVEFFNVGDRLIEQSALQTLEIDFQEVEPADSSGLVLMLSWLRHCRRLGKAVNFLNVPESLQHMAQICGVTSLLSLYSF